MADGKEEVIISIDIQQDEGDFKKLADLKGSLIALKTEQKELQKALKEGAITQKEYNSEIVRVEALQKKVQAQYNATQRSVTGLKNPINELNKTIEKQNTLVQTQNQRFGAAVPALDRMTGWAASATQGIFSMVKASLAFIATPIGAVVAALGLAIGALTAYFKGSEEGQDRLTRITTVLSVVFNKLMVIVEDIGEAIFFSGGRFDSFTKKFGILGVAADIAWAPLKLIIAGLEQLGKITGLDKVVDDVVKTGEAIAALNDQIEADENELIVRRAETNAQVQALREKAIKEEGAQKAATIAEAIQLEKDLAKAEQEHITDKLEAFDLEAATTGRLTEEQKKQRAELLAAQINALAEGASATIKFQKELERLQDAQEAKENKAEEDRKERNKKRVEDAIKTAQDLQKAEEEQFKTNLEFLQKQSDERFLLAETAYANGILSKEEFEELYSALELQALEDRKAFLIANGEETIAIDRAIADAKIKNLERETDSKKKILDGQKKVNKDQIELAQQGAATLAGLLKEGTKEYKLAAVTETGISTYSAAQKAYESQFIPGDPTSIFRAVAAAAFSVIQGLARVKTIAGFSHGGFTGHGGVYEPAGVVHRGEVVWSQADVAAYGGAQRVDRMRPTYRGYATGGIVGNETRTATMQANSQVDINQIAALLNQVQPVLILEQFEAKQNSVNQIQQRAVVIQ